MHSNDSPSPVYLADNSARAACLSEINSRKNGGEDDLARRVYRGVLLDTLVHEFNAVRGLLGEPDRLAFVDLGEHSVTSVFDFGAIRCVIAWVDLPGIARYEQNWAFYAPNARATLRFPSPFLRSMPTRLVLEGGEPGTASAWRSRAATSRTSGRRPGATGCACTTRLPTRRS